MDEVEFILIEPCNYSDHPVGGQLNFARQLLDVYGAGIATVGYTLDPAEPIAVWFKKETDGVVRDHFNLACLSNGGGGYRLPRRLLFFFLFKKYRKAIRQHPCRKAFIQEHAILMAIQKKDWDSICYCFPGVSSPLDISRFKWAKLLSRTFDCLLFRSTKKAKVLLAAADQKAIAELKQRAGRVIAEREIISFPTRIDTKVFTLKQNSLRGGRPVQLVSSGRLHWAKGWDLILRSLALLKEQMDFEYTYVGDGPDREAFLQLSRELRLEGRVTLTGFSSPAEVADCLKKADLYLMGSIVEGWPTTLIEAYASGLPMVCTKVSGATTIISEGLNGYICDSRDPEMYAACILKALELNPERVFNSVDASCYATSRLKADLEMVWQ
jgi:glycosyltransferase involved in cell wall biosynthesis